MAKEQVVELGDKVKDKIGGFTGIVTGYCKHLTGCDRVNVQAPAGKDGKIGECYSFDIFAVEIVTKGKCKIENPEARVNGGPPTVPVRHR